MDSFNNYIVDSRQLIVNAINIKNNLSIGTKLCAIVKANAYGLGIETVCKTLKTYCDYFGVACIKEAKQIRSFDADSKILILSRVPKSAYEWCSNNNVSITVSTLSELNDIASIATNINIHIAVNTGLNRIGTSSTKELKKMINFINDNTNIKLEGMFSHFATKSNDIVFIKKQFYKFGMYRKLLKSNIICHIANSYGTIFNKMYHLNMVRCGYLLYDNINSNECKNKPVLSIESKIIHISKVLKGESIGYDRNYVATKDMIVGVVPIGYADGLDRRLSNLGYFYINNKKCPIIGNICMDACMVDITNTNAQLFDEVLVLGTNGVNNIRLDDIAKLLATSPYEIQLKFRYNRMNYIVI